MPISNYTVLKALGYGGAPYEINSALAALAPFNLFVFIIHDPETHSDFDKVIDHRFDFLDYVTGDKLLFFALVDPPGEWLRHAEHRHYYRQVTSWQTQELLNPKHAVTSTDKGITAFSLANSLRIPSEMLPCLVITSDFRTREFIWFKTCPDHVEEQLKKLGYIAERGGESFSKLNRALLYEIIRREGIDLCEGTGAESLEGSLAKALTDVLSFIIAGSDRDSWLRRQALEQAQQTVTELHAALTKLKTHFDESKTEELDRLCLNIVSFLSNLNAQKDLNLDEFITIDRACLENDSYQILKTAHKVLNLFMSKQGREALPRFEESVDFTPAVICLAKVFEKEINLSVVHWMRKELGIVLPPYFNKYQPGVRARFPSFQGGREIDFNMERQGKWLAPGIGQSENACKQMSKMKTPPDWIDSNWNLLLSRWKVIREKRNEAAHTELVDEQSVFQVRNALDELARSQIFQSLYQMKTTYRGC